MPVPCLRRAFSLIEVLVVIAIITLLLALLMPMLSKARETARTAQCLSNQRQMAFATYNYAEQCRGFLPIWAFSHPADFATYPGSDRHIAWLQRLTHLGLLPPVDYNDVGTTVTRVCPSVDRRGIYPVNSYSYQDAFGYYATDIYLTGFYNVTQVIKNRTLDSIRDHSQVYQLTDSEIWLGESQYYNLSIMQARNLGRPYAYGANYRTGASSYSTPLTDLVSHRHDGDKVNFTFLDGHGRTARYKAEDSTGFGSVHFLDWNTY